MDPVTVFPPDEHHPAFQMPKYNIINIMGIMLLKKNYPLVN